MATPPLLERLKQARIVQVLLVYLGTCWAILQVVDVLQQGLRLPGWVVPVTLILLFIGLVIILATAWIQSLPSTTAREEAGEIPTDWQIAPADVLASLRAGRLPHLTWGRAILGGVTALSLLFGVAGALVLFTDMRLPIGPQEAGAGEAATGIAVVPFSVSGEDLDVWREGMVDLLSTGLDGLGGYRSIDSRTVISRWRSAVGDATDVDLREALSVAGAAGARFAVVGSAVSLGGRVRLAADVYDVADGSKVGQAQAEGAPDQVLALADRLAVNVIRQLLGSRGSELVSESQVASLSTSSVEALRSYLLGESLMRRGEFERAASAYEEAVDQDSTFAMAYYRLTSTYGWMEAGGDRAERAELALRALAENLPPRDRLLLEGEEALQRGDVDGVRLMEEATKRYPDDPDAWAMLGELYAHGGARILTTSADVYRAFHAAVGRDPTFSPNYIHLTEAAMIGGRGEEARTLLDRYLELAPETHQGVAMSLGWALQFGDEASVAAAAAALDTLGGHTSSDLTNGLGPSRRGVEALRTVATARLAHDPSFWLYYSRFWTNVALGDLDAARSILQSIDANVAPQATFELRLADPTAALPATTPADCDGIAPCLFYLGAIAADLGDADVLADVRRALEEARSGATESGQADYADEFEAVLDALEAQRRWRAGEGMAVAEAMDEIQRRAESWNFAEPLRLWMGEIAIDNGRLELAERVLASLERAPTNWYGLLLRGRAAVAAGDTESARAHYGDFLQLWADAPADHPLVLEARAVVDAT